MVVGDVPVRLVSIARGGDAAGTADSQCLVVTVEVKNPSARDKLEFAGWSRDAALRGATLTDDQGKTLCGEAGRRGRRAGHAPAIVDRAGRVGPGRALLRVAGSQGEVVAIGVAGRGLRKERLGQFPNPRQDDCRQAGGGEVGAQDRIETQEASQAQAGHARIRFWDRGRRGSPPLTGGPQGDRLMVGMVLDRRSEESMLKSVEGVYREGKVELLESVPEGMTGRVIVTFVSSPVGAVDLAARGIGPEQAADLRHRLAAFAEDWQRPEMDVYDAL